MRDRLVLREDFELIVSFAHRILFVFLDFLLTKQNGRGHVLRCSHFQPAEYLENDETDDIQKLRPKSDPFPCVIYCHGNAGSRVDALPLLPVFLPHGISVCSFDFAGAGQSEGQYLSLGHFEKEDLRTVIEFLMSSKRVSRIGLWAHSMGASSCLLYAADGANDAVSAMVLDSPFSSLEAVIAETAASGKQKLSESGMVPGMKLMPDMLIPMAVAAIRRSILSQASFDIKEVSPINKCGTILIPAVFGHGEDDDMVAPYHSQRLHDAYGGNTTLLRFAGSHNSQRGDLFMCTATAFVLALLRPSDQPHPAQGLLYPQPSKLRGLMGRPATAESSRFTAGKGFQSAGVDAGGERCSHRGRTAGNLALLVKLCCLCNPAIRPPPRAVARRYRIVSPPASPAVGPIQAGGEYERGRGGGREEEGASGEDEGSARRGARTAADGDWVVERRGGSDGGEERLGAAAWLGGAEAQAEAARPSAVGGTEPLAGMALTAPDDVAVATAAHCDGRHATA